MVACRVILDIRGTIVDKPSLPLVTTDAMTARLSTILLPDVGMMSEVVEITR